MSFGLARDSRATQVEGAERNVARTRSRWFAVLGVAVLAAGVSALAFWLRYRFVQNVDMSVAEFTSLWAARRTMETGAPKAYGLLTRPNQAGDGWISKQFPFIDIRSSDHFTAEIGCLAGATECDVNFQIDYTTRNGATGRLGR